MGGFVNKRNAAASRYSQEDYTAPTEGVDEAAVLANQAEQAMEDVISGSEELEAMGNDGDELVQTYGEVLPEVQEIVEATGETGGIATEAVGLLAIIGELTGTRMGAAVAQESYVGGRSNQARRVALEAVSDHLRNWWQALKRWLTKMWKKLKDWWNKTFSGAASVKAAAEALKKRAQGMSNKTVKNENVSFGGAEYLIDSNGKVQSANIQSGLKSINGAIETLLGDHQRRMVDAGKEVVERLAEINFEGDGTGAATADSNTTVQAVKKALGNVISEVQKTAVSLGIKDGKPASGTLGTNPVFDKNLPAGATLKVSPTFPGNRVLYLVTNGLDEMTFDFDAAGNKTPEGDLEPKALSISEVTGIAGTITEICDTVVRANSSINSSDKVKNDLESAGDKVERVLASTDKSSDGATKLSSTFQRAARGLAAALNEPQHKFTAYALSACNAAIRYGNASLATAG